MTDPEFDPEQDIYDQFTHKGMALLDAIEALKRLGYDSIEAERIVFEWVDGLEEHDDESDIIG
jgi:hypothetical protein